MDSSITWEVGPESIPYLLVDDVTVEAGATLTIEGGVLVKANHGSMFSKKSPVRRSTPMIFNSDRGYCMPALSAVRIRTR